MPSQALPIRSPIGTVPEVLGQGNFYLTDRHHHVAALQLSDNKVQQMFTALFPKGRLKMLQKAPEAGRCHGFANADVLEDQNDII